VENVQKLFQDSQLLGLNVTIPYKEKIIPYLDELSDEAREIGAVNTIHISNGHRKGYNTDAFGFEKTLLLMKKDFQKSALILGDGGAAKAVQYIFKKHEIPFQIISRKTGTSFEELNEKMVFDNLIIVQCTPVGTFPNVEDCLDFPFYALSSKHLVIDLIYNPTLTSFLKKSQMQQAQTVNGLFMLEQQAEKAWEIWNKNEKTNNEA
jgi:shikimate dehydrogenase